MPGKDSEKCSNALSIRCYKLREEGYTLTEIAEIVQIDRDKVKGRIELGERLLSLVE